MDFKLNLDSETVGQAYPEEPLLVPPSATVDEVLRLMKSRNRGSVMICDAAGKLAGIFTERDAVKILASQADLEVAIEQVMVRNPVTLTADDTVGKAISMMSSGGYRRMPILDEAGQPVGVLGVSGILAYLVGHFPKAVYTLPPGPHHSMQEREGA